MTTDIDGSPILCITADDAEDIWLALRLVPWGADEPVYEKITKFLEAVDKR